MKFARIVFVAAGVWGIVILTPFYFLFDAIGRLYASPINYPQGYYGFLAITMAWQCAFLLIGSNPARYRLMMIPSMVEKFGYVLTIGVLYIQGRIGATDALVVSPDLLWGVMFTTAFSKMSALTGRQDLGAERARIET